MLLGGVSLLVAIVAVIGVLDVISVVEAIGPIKAFFFTKDIQDYLALSVVYDPDSDPINVLAQMGSVESWFAVEGCAGDVCKELEPPYTATPIFCGFLDAHYKCPVVGRGKPFAQAIQVNVDDPSEQVNQVILAVDYLNDLFPTSQFFSKPPATGVMGLGPICSRSCLVKQFDAKTYSASILQNLFRLRFPAMDGLQQFYFERALDDYGARAPFTGAFVQVPLPATDPQVANLIPIVKGACTWTFKIASPVTILNSTDGVFATVRKPSSITLDPTMDFNIVSQEMAEAYAAAFNEVNSSPAAKESYGDLVVYRYYTGDSSNLPSPSFPPLTFSALNTDGDEVDFGFFGSQGVYIQGEADKLTFYLSFAYLEKAPCCASWVLGWPAVNGVPTDPDEAYTYPRMVVNGTSTGITSYSLLLASGSSP